MIKDDIKFLFDTARSYSQTVRFGKLDKKLNECKEKLENELDVRATFEPEESLHSNQNTFYYYCKCKRVVAKRGIFTTFTKMNKPNYCFYCGTKLIWKERT